MNKTDAKDYRKAAELIASGKQEFTCNALEFQKDNFIPKIGRGELIELFKDVFSPSETQSFYVFWDNDAPPNCPTKTNSREHSRECRIFALLFMAEMIENP